MNKLFIPIILISLTACSTLKFKQTELLLKMQVNHKEKTIVECNGLFPFDEAAKGVNEKIKNWDKKMDNKDFLLLNQGDEELMLFSLKDQSELEKAVGYCDAIAKIYTLQGYQVKSPESR